MLKRSLLVLVAALVPACSNHPSVVCTLIGAESGIRFELAAVLPGHGSSSVETCINGVCHQRRLTDGQSGLQVGDPKLKSADSVSVSVRITSKSGRTLFAAETAVTPRMYQPNGPNCAPTVWIGTVRASGKHRLVAV